MRRLIGVLGVGIGLILLVSVQIAGAAPGTTLYGVDSFTDSLWEIDLVTGGSTLVGRLDPLGDPDPNIQPNRFATPVAMTVRQSDGTIFVWNNSACLRNPGAHCRFDLSIKSELITVNPSTGEATAVSPSPQVGFQAIAYDPLSATLYGLGGSLFTIDQTTGIVSFVTAMSDSGGGSIRLSGAAFDSCGTLFGLELVNTTSGQSRLFTIDTTTGLATLVGGIQNPGLTGSIAFAPDGNLVGSASGIGTLFDIDPTTASVSNPRGTGLRQGLGFVTDSPGPCGPVGDGDSEDSDDRSSDDDSDSEDSDDRSSDGGSSSEDSGSEDSDDRGSDEDSDDHGSDDDSSD